MTHADRLREIAGLARSVSSELELETVLSHVTAALRALRPDVVCAVRLIDHDAGGYRLAGTDGFPAAGRMELVPFGEGLTHVVAKTRKPLLVADNRADPRAVTRHWSAPRGFTLYYGVPIEAGAELLGVININFPPAAPPTEDEQASIDVLAGEAAVAIRNARLFAESEARRRAAESLAEVSRALARTLDVDVTVQQIADTLCQLLRAHCAFVFRLAPESDDLVFAAISGEPGADYHPGLVLPAGSGLAGLAVRTRAAVQTPDVLRDPRVVLPAERRAAIERTPDRAVLAVPLTIQGRVIGAFSIRDRPGRVFGPDDRALAEAFADQAAVALENARLYTDGARRRREAEALARVARTLAERLDVVTVADRIVESVLPLLAVQSAVLRRLEPDGSLVAIAVGGRARDHFERGHVVPPGIGVVGRVVDERRPIAREVADETSVVLTDDLRGRLGAAGMRVILAVPLCVQDDILGVLAVADAVRRRFSTDDVALLQAFADHAALALQNARLYQDVRDARDFLQGIAQNSADGIVTTDSHGRITSFSQGAEEILGYRAAEVFGRRIADHYQGGLDEGHAIMQRLRAGGRIKDYETTVRNKDGQWITTSLSIALLRDADDAIVGTLGVFRDITERKRADEALRQSEEQVRQLQKLEAVGQLAGGVAHDFTNLLTVIRGRSDLLLLRLPAESPLRRDIALIHTTAGRAAALTKQLLAFSRKQLLEPRVLDLNAVVAGMAAMLERLIGETVELAVRPGQDLGRVKADPAQLEQVIVNLVVNARDAMPQGGRITVETANVELDAQYARAHPDVSPGPYVSLAVSDTGIGMDAKTRARIFEPFFTTKPPGRGTGLGLSTVFGIVKQSGGAIGVESEPGKGTTFEVYLPRVEGAADEAVEGAGARAGRGMETILVVEDEAQVRMFMRDALTSYGYRVFEAARPAEAVVIADRHLGAIHLLLTDVVMPQMNGPELAERLAPVRPEMKVLYMSGYADHAIVDHVRVDPGTSFIEKPLTPDALAAKVRAVLDAPDEG